jgi:hypothetical protein
MRLTKALKLFPRAITPSKVIHFVYDLEARDMLAIYPLCKVYTGEVLHGSFNIPHDAITDWPSVVEHMGGKGRWRYCQKCLDKIKTLGESDGYY